MPPSYNWVNSSTLQIKNSGEQERLAFFIYKPLKFHVVRVFLLEGDVRAYDFDERGGESIEVRWSGGKLVLQNSELYNLLFSLHMPIKSWMVKVFLPQGQPLGIREACFHYTIKSEICLFIYLSSVCLFVCLSAQMKFVIINFVSFNKYYNWESKPR